MSSFQKSEESCCLLQNSNQPSKAGGGWGARFSVTNDILWLQNFEAFIWQPWESKKKKKKKAITTGCFYLKGSSTSEKSSIRTTERTRHWHMAEMHLWAQLCLHTKKTWSCILFYMTDMCHASHREQHEKEGLGTRLWRLLGRNWLCVDTGEAVQKPVKQ